MSRAKGLRAKIKVMPRPDGCLCLELASGERRTCRPVLSTMPLTLLVRALPDVRQNVLNACGRARTCLFLATFRLL
ncbi:MAG: hypothetical protein QUT30_17610 [Acidobacteriota bacterium]|jgi:hypothetical protein|nr:hypothetical protein [Acidobacteriota bacterium]